MGIAAGNTIMGKHVQINDTFVITTGKTWLSSDGKSRSVQVFFSANGTGAEFILEAGEGAKWSDGGCMGARTTLTGGVLTMPSDTTKVSVKGAWGKCTSEPPFPCQIYMTTKDILTTDVDTVV